MGDDPLLALLEQVQQLVPQEWCLRCRGCCRFADPADAQTPTWSPIEVQWATTAGASPAWFRPAAEPPSSDVRLVPLDSGCGHRCPAFDPPTNHCTIYAARPLDCRIYPFTLTRDATRRRVMVAADPKCPYVRQLGASDTLRDYGWYLSRLLESAEGQRLLADNPALAGRPRDEFWMVQPVTDPRPPELAPAPAGFEPLAQHPDEFETACQAVSRPLSTYHRAAWLPWRDLLQVWWGRLDGQPCLIAEQAGGYFLALPPLVTAITQATLQQLFARLRQLNPDAHGLCRIEGVPEAVAARCRQWGYRVEEVEREYLYDQQTLLSRLARRGSGHAGAVVRPYRPDDAEACLRLYTLWALQRQAETDDSQSRAMLRDGFYLHRRWLEEAEPLGMIGWVVEVEGQLQGYALGYYLSAETFVVAAEVTNLVFEGLATRLQRAWSQELPVRWINVMGDAGLARLARAKMAEEPQEVRSVYAVRA